MRLIKMFGLAALAAVAAMAFVGATSASAGSTQLCTSNASLTCGAGNATTSVHQVLPAGEVGILLASVTDVLCLNVLVEATPLGLANPQSVHATSMSFTGCGTNDNHNNATVTVQELPLSNVLKTGPDEGVLTATNGRTRLQIPSLFLDCVYDTEGIEFAVGAGHLTASETEVTELGGKFFCPNEGFLDGLLETLVDTYVAA